MRASEDNADDEFVFVANKVVTGPECPSGDAPAAGARGPRTLPRLNHLQPIPTTLDLQPTPKPWRAVHPPTTTTARAKATPLPPELIELLPPHLRENTVPDFGGSSPPPADEAAPQRPPLPAKYCSGDYYNLDDAPAPPASQLANYGQLSGLIPSSALNGVAATHTHAHGGRAASLTSTRPQAHAGGAQTASHTAPAALALTDSGISSGGSSNSSSCSSVSSRSSSSKSLPREGSRTSLSGRPLHPPSPKFARAAPSPAPPAPAAAPAEPLLTRVSYTAVLTSDGERASMVRRLEALTPSPSPLLNTFRAAHAHPEHLPPEARPHTRHVATAHSTLNSMGQTKSTSSTSVTTHAPTPSATPTHTPSHTPTHTPTQRRKVRGGGENPQSVGGQGRASPSAPSSAAMIARQVASPRPYTPTAATPTPPSPRPQCRQISGRPPEMGPASPPSSPELRRAWNVVGVPVVSPSGSCTPSGRSPAPSPVPRPLPAAAEPDSIYDNLVVRQPPLSTPTSRSPPTASIPPTAQRTGAAAAHRQGPPATPPPRKVTQSPIVGKPPSPPMQRRGASRSPTPPPAWAQQGIPPRAQYVPYYPPPDAHCGGCWVPVWGSSPQLYQPPGSTPVYPAYVYHAPPAGVICEARSRSCERLPARPSPPSSPRSGRRSASPWRGGSPSPAGARHSPSPDPVSGRPPRPRRPPMRKSKTVEVGCLGVGLQQSSSAPVGGASEPTPLPAHSITYLQGPPAPGVPSNHVYIHALNHQGAPPYRSCSQGRQQHIPSFDTIHEQLGKVANGFHEPRASDASAPAAGGSGPGAPRAPSPAGSSCNSSSVSVGSPGVARLEQSQISKPKVTYKSSLYKCMKNLLKPIQ